jgi:hypothetical protein
MARRGYTQPMGIFWRSGFVALLIVALVPVAPIAASSTPAADTSAAAPTAAAATAATAAVRSGFDPGNIISDAIFYNSTTMSTVDIQNFLNQRVPNCSSGYTCLKNYRQSYEERTARTYGCTAIPAGNSVAASEIIRNVSQACGINPQALLTLLEKEQSLVSSTSPSDGRYRSATGYACPDTAACDSAYYGFFNQVYNAARQFKYYQSTQNSWNYRAGRTNTILWHPNQACGSSQVYISNQATAGLYIYTPYRPNEAALNNLYGSGDGCSSYGNRNFWRIFTDWFGSTTISEVMVRSSDGPQIWLLSNGEKLPINNPDIYNSLAPLGGVGVVSPSYLASLPTKPEVSRFIGDSAGNLYFIDSGKRYHFDSCSRVNDWGYSCLNWTSLEDRIVAMIPSGGQLNNVIQDAGSKYWQVTTGTRRQAVDATALQAVDGNPRISMSVAALARLTIAEPILRDNIVIKPSNTSTYWLNSGELRTLPASLFTESTIDTSLPLRSLLPESTALLEPTGVATGVISAADGPRYLLTELGRVEMAADADVNLETTVVSTATLNAIASTSGTAQNELFVRGVGTQAVYYAREGVRQYIASWDDYTWLTATTTNDTIYVIPNTTIEAMPLGGLYLRPGTIVRAVGTPSAYLVDGTSSLIRILSYDITNQLGLGQTSREIPQSAIDALPKAAQPLTRAVSCDGAISFGVGGTLRAADSGTTNAYLLTAPTVLNESTCDVLRSGPALTRFIRLTSGAVYYVDEGKRRYIPNSAVLTALGGSASTITDMSDVSARGVSADVPLTSADTSVRPSFIRASGAPSVFYVRDGARSHIQSWDDYLYAARDAATSTIVVSPPSVVKELPLGPIYLRPGMFVRPSDSPGVVLLDGATNRVVLGSMGPHTALGGRQIVVVSPTDLAAYTTTSTSHLFSALTCGTDSYIGLGGKLHLLTDETRAYFGTPRETALSPSTCQAFPKATTTAGRFLVASTGTVYLMENGVKRQVRSPAGFETLGGNWSTLIGVSDYTLSLFPTGAAIG